MGDADFHVLLSVHCGQGDCDREPQHFCTGCYNVAYCSEECAEHDWKERHKEEHTLNACEPLEHSQDLVDYEMVETQVPSTFVFGLLDEQRDFFLVEARKGGRRGGRRGAPKAASHRRAPRGRGRGRRTGGKKKWMQGAVKRPGALTRKAKAAGYGSALAFARHVMAHKKDYDLRTRRQAQFAITASHARHR